MRQIKNARSFQNGIMFYSNILPEVGLRAYYDENGEIKTMICTNSRDEIREDSNQYRKNKITAIIFSFILIALVLLTRKIAFIYAAVWFSFFSAESLFTILYGMRRTKKADERGQTIAKFHAAEHMAINAYERLGRVPTIEEIKSESYFSKKCGSLTPILKACGGLLVALTSIISGILFYSDINYAISLTISIMVGILASIFMILGKAKSYFMYLEIFFLSKPSDKEIILAQKGIEEFEKKEEHFKEELLIYSDILSNFNAKISESDDQQQGEEPKM